MRLFVGLLLLLGITVSFGYEKKRYDGDKVLRLTPANQYQLQLLQSFQDAPGDQFDFWSDPGHINSPVDVRVAADSYTMFRQMMNISNIKSQVMVDDVQQLIERVDKENELNQLSRANDIVGTFPSFDDTMTWVEQICDENPTLATCGDVGKSTEGRTFKYLKLGAQSTSKAAKKKVWIEGTMHAREWLSTATVVYLIDRLVNTYSTDPEAKRLLDDYDWWIVPISNPDGYQYSQDKERLWRKTRSNYGGRCYGVDPNRNWDFRYGEGGASTSPCSDTYRGPNAWSEPETKAISDLITANKDNTHIYFSIHTYSQYWLIPYGTGALPDDFSELERVATIGTNALQAVNNKRWKAGNIIDLLYTASGGSIDWAKGAAGIKYSYCLELRPSRTSLMGFVVSTSEIDPSGREVWAGMVAAIDAIPN